MCCHIRPGAQAVREYLSQTTGVWLSMKDWHHLRRATEKHLGHGLPYHFADDGKVARVARDLILKYEGSPAEKQVFIRIFTHASDRQANVPMIQLMMDEDILRHLSQRSGRVSAQQTAETREEFPELKEETDEDCLWEIAQADGAAPAARKAAQARLVELLANEPHDKPVNIPFA